ncbi:MAG: hypothetical protein HYY25_06915 [Candidatus Wallbacteria bacterium]|nr:hypothetical protein [Candidatus Wallbacteria bacterium]
MKTRTLIPLLFALASSLWAASAPRTLDFPKLIAGQPCLEEVASAARASGVTFGVYGGTVRDLFLGQPFTVISDYDLIFDTSEKGFPAFREAVFAIAARNRGKMPIPDFHFNLDPAVHETERQKQFHTEGVTATKLGVMSDGRVLDPTGFGVRDLANGMFRFHSPRPRPSIDLHNLGRFVRDMVRLPGFRVDPASLELFGSSLERHATVEGARTRAAVAACRRLDPASGLITFRALIKPFRKDVRYLHNGLDDRCTAAFPVDVFLFDLFKCVTQASDVTAMRAVFRTVGVDRFLRAAGLGPEADVLMDEDRNREALFAAFQFPGHLPPGPTRRPILETWERTLRKYNYRTLFDMLASEFPAGGREAQILKERRDDFLRDSSYRLFDPGDEYGEEILGFLDTDFNVFRLPRQQVERSMQWFLETYLPRDGRKDDRVLRPISERPAAASTTETVRGYAPDVQALDPNTPHSMPDLRAYLELQVGRELVPAFLDPRVTIAFVAGPRAVAVAAAASRGFTLAQEANACGLSRRRRTLIASAPGRDKVCVAFYGYHSGEQLLNEQARFLFLGVPARRVLTMRGTETGGFPDQAALARMLDGDGRKPSVLFVGFTNPLKRLLGAARSQAVGDLAITRGSLPDGRMAVALSGFGASYGSLPARIAAFLAERGLQIVVFVGSAGGLAGPTRRFQWVVPDRVTRVGPVAGGPIAIENRAAALRIPGALREALHVTVWTPLVETQDWARRAKAAGIASVDCELYPLVRAARACSPPLTVYALLNVTDFPRSRGERTTDQGGIDAENSPEQREAVTKALRGIVLDLAQRAGRTPFRSHSVAAGLGAR